MAGHFEVINISQVCPSAALHLPNCDVFVVCKFRTPASARSSSKNVKVQPLDYLALYCGQLYRVVICTVYTYTHGHIP